MELFSVIFSRNIGIPRLETSGNVQNPLMIYSKRRDFWLVRGVVRDFGIGVISDLWDTFAGTDNRLS
jgi:hypothetical protein